MAHDPQILAAIEQNNSEILRDLLSTAGNPLNENNESYFDVAASKILKEKGPNSLKVLEELLRNGILPTGRVKFSLNCYDNLASYTPLVRAIRQDLPLLFDFLLKNSADLNKTTEDNDGISPVCEAARAAQPIMLQALIDAGANVFVGYGGYDPLGMVFVRRKEEEMFKNKEYMEKSAQCIYILLENYAGIGAVFSLLDNKNAISGLNFERKICLGAKINAEQKRSLGNPILTVDDYAATLPNDKDLALKEVSKMIEICTKIAQSCRQSDVNMYKRVINVIKEFSQKYPELKFVFEPTKLSEPTKKAENKGPFTRLLGIFRSTPRVVTTPVSSMQTDLRPPPVISSQPPSSTPSNPVQTGFKPPAPQQKR